MVNQLKYLVGAICTIPLLPLMYIQGKQIRAKVPSLPEATGNEGIIDATKQADFQLLAIGESTVAGVGVKTHEEGFTGTLAKTLAQKSGKNIRWKVYAKSGITAKRVPAELIATITEPKADLIVIGLGANDAFEGNSPNTWRKGIEQTLAALRAKFPKTPIFFANMPPIKEFPAFTPLIKQTIGNLVELHGQELQQIIAHQPAIFYNAEILWLKDWLKGALANKTVHDFFSDGVHPSKLTYQEWAKDFAAFIELKIAFQIKRKIS